MEKSKLLRVVSLVVLAFGVVVVHGEIKTFRTQAITLGPGEVTNGFYKMQMPSGHVGIKSFKGDLVDEDGNLVPTSTVYFHHRTAEKLHAIINTSGFASGIDYFYVPNSGPCKSSPQFFGFGSETRHTGYYVREPYVIEIGNPESIPDGYEEQWLLNVHAIDTRGTVNPLHCFECLCASYNVSVTETGKKVPEEYLGGLDCCLHGYHCALEEGVHGTKNNLYFQYTVEYVLMQPSLKPVRVYILDVTDNRTSATAEPGCMLEYDVLPCDKSKDVVCQNEKSCFAWLPEEKEVDVIYASGHVHTGGVYIKLHGEDGRDICTSRPIYETGNEAGDEVEYIVGMGSCSPEIGSARIKPGESLHLKAMYNSEDLHTGVMGIMNVFVADAFQVSNQRDSLSVRKTPAVGVVVTVAALAVVGFSLIRFVQRKRDGRVYESLIQG